MAYDNDTQAFLDRLGGGRYDDDTLGFLKRLDSGEAAPESPKKSSVMDYVRPLASGALQGVGSIAQGGGELVARGANAAFGTDLRAINPMQGAIDYLNDAQSPDAKKAVADTDIKGELLSPETWDFGKDPSVKGLALQGLNAIGQFAPNLALALTTAGASLPVQLSVGAVTGGLQALGAGAEEERSRFNAMKPEELRASSTLYRELVDRGTSPEVAKNAVAEAAALGGGLGNAIPSAGEGAFENFLVGALTKGKIKIPAMFGKGLPGRVATGIAGGAATGGSQEAIENATQNLGSNLAVGGNRPLGEGSLQQFIMGALAEGAAGGGAGAFKPHPVLVTKPPKSDTTTPDAGILGATNLDAVIAAAEHALDEPALKGDLTTEETGAVDDLFKTGTRASRALPHYAGPPMVSFPDGSVLTGAEAAAQETQAADQGTQPLDSVLNAGAVAGPVKPEGVIDRARRTAHYDPAVAEMQQEAAPEPAAIEVPSKPAPGAGFPPAQTTQQEYAAALEKQSRGELLSSYERVLLDNAPATPQIEVAPARAGRDPASMSWRELALAAKLTRSEERRADISAEIERRAVPTPSTETPDARAVEVPQPTEGGVRVETQAPVSEGTVGPEQQTQAPDRSAPEAPVRAVDGPSVQAAPAAAAATPAASGEPVAPAAAEAGTGGSVPAPVAHLDYTAPKAVTNAQGKTTVYKGEVRTFRSERVAKAFAKQQGLPQTWTPRDTGEGWVLSKPYVQKTPEQVAAAKAERATAKVTDSAFTIIQKAGGWNQTDALADRVDPSELKARPFLFRKAGLSIDGIAEILDSNGFDVRDENGAIDATKAREIMEQSFAGPVYSTEGAEIRRAADEAARARYEARHSPQERAETGYADAATEVQAASAQLADTDLDAVNAAARMADEQEGRVTDEQVAEWEAEDAKWAAESGGDSSRPDAGAEGRGVANRAEDGGAAQEEGTLEQRSQSESDRAQKENKPALELTGETNAEILAKEAVARQNTDEQRKRDNAPSEKGFTLTGSDRQVDEAEARGQKPLLSQKRQSIDTSPRHGVSSDTFTTALEQAFGERAAGRLLDSGIVTPVERQSDLPQSILKWARDGDVIYGVEYAGKTYAVLENLSPEMVRPLVMHEVGVHHGFQAMLGPDRYRSVMKRLDAMVKGGNVAAREARAQAIREAADESQVPEETLAYLVQNHPEMTFVQQIISAIKTWVYRNFGIGASHLTANDLAALARAAVLHSVSQETPVISTEAQPAWHRAYHGTPHDFDRFSTEHIGSGEGAQAYGWGLYFAGKREVAEHYKRSLTRNPIISIDGVALDQGRDLSASAKQSFERMAHGRLVNRLNNGSTPKDVQRMAALLAAESRRDAHLANDAGITREREEGVAARLDEIHQAAVAGKVTVSPGRLYEVELAPKEDEYLDWDKPLNQQSSGVQEKLAQLGVRPVTQEVLAEAKLQREEAFDRWHAAESKLRPSNTTLADAEESGRLAGEAQRLRREFEKAQRDEDRLKSIEGMSGSKVYREISGSDREASERLASVGIPGIKYLDGSSRHTNQGPYTVKEIAGRWAAINRHPNIGAAHTYFDTEEEARAYVESLTQNQHNYVIFDDKHVEVKAKFSRSGTPAWADSEALKSATSKVDTYAPGESFKQKAQALKENWKERLVQGVFDAYAPLKRLGATEYLKARMVKSADGALEGMLLHGKPKMGEDGAIYGDLDRKGFLGAMQELKGEHDRFFMWVAGNRASRLMQEGREHLFTKDEIKAMQGLAEGDMKDGSSRTKAYAKAAETLREYNKAVLDIAERTGLIDKESRHLWEHDFYVPFFRVGDDMKIDGPSTKIKGLVRQQAFKKLTGGTEPLGDLLANTLQNWSHLISASMANQAAVASLKAAKKVGIAEEVPEGTKGATYAMQDGKKVHYAVDDPFILSAISAMESASFKGLPMAVMSKFKHYLTLGVTVSPTFRVRNLIRDSLSAIGQNEMSYNVLENLAKGYKGTDRKSDEYAQMLFSGALMRFGQLTDGKHAEHAKRLIASGVDEDSILTGPEKVKAALGKVWDEWQEFGDRMENINRTALYKQLKADGKSDLEAAFAARDMMDFSLQGSWTAVRFLTQIVPFMNARLQGLYKLGRSASDNPARLGYVLGATALASIALMLAYKDDDEWKKREDWDRDNFWWFKVGDKAFRIPKPFEIGAMGTLAERSVELAISDEMTGKRFAARMQSMLGDTFSLNPVPQLFKPMLDLYSNKDSFTGRQIETRGMENLSKSERMTPGTSLVAKVLGKAGDATGLSPVQIDHLLHGYFGWLGAHAAMTADMMAQPFMDSTKPSRRLGDTFVLGDFVKDLPSDRSRYVEQFYEQAQAVHEVMGDLKHAREAHDLERVQEILQDKKSDVALAHFYTTAERRMGEITRQIRVVNASKKTADEKRAEIDRWTEIRNELAKSIETKATRVREVAGQ